MRLLIYILLSFASYSLVAQDDIIPITTKSNPFKGEVFTVVEEMPEFTGGESGLQKFYHENSKHPVVEKNRKAKVVYYQIVVDEEGNVTNFKILRGQSDGLNKLTEELISKMPKWKPGKQNSRAVKVLKNLSIRYATLD